MLNWIFNDTDQYLELFNFVDLFFQIIYISYIWINRILHYITHNGLYAIKAQPNQNIRLF